MEWLGVGVAGGCVGVAAAVSAYHLPRTLYQTWHEEAAAWVSSSLSLPETSGSRWELLAISGGSVAGALVSWSFFAEWWVALSYYVAFVVLLMLAVIDLRTHLLPDVLTLPLLWGGLLFHAAYEPWGLDMAVLGAALGYVVLWLPSAGAKWCIGQALMGQGDAKLFAALGAWLGLAALPGVFIVAALGFVVTSGALMVLGRLARGTALPFGPWLALGGIVQGYLGFQ